MDGLDQYRIFKVAPRDIVNWHCQLVCKQPLPSSKLHILGSFLTINARLCVCALFIQVLSKLSELSMFARATHRDDSMIYGTIWNIVNNFFCFCCLKTFFVCVDRARIAFRLLKSAKIREFFFICRAGSSGSH